MSKPHILVTGGAGFIGSHTVIELLKENYPVTIVDNFSNSKREVLNRIREITGKSFQFFEGSILDSSFLESVFTHSRVDAVIHFAAFKAVGESVEKPLMYYRNNITGTLSLLEAMKKAGCKNLVFSSSSTVYGDPVSVPVTEDFPLSVTNPYGRTKLMMEDMLRDLHHAEPDWAIGLLRYFNPVGAHESGRIGEDPSGIPNNLMPYITQVAVGRREYLQVFGSDYPTPDGTGVRDYIHVSDVATGHIRMLEKLFSSPKLYTYNLGTGVGYSVLDVVKAFEKANGVSIPYRLVNRRPGDIAENYANPGKANEELSWKAKRGIEEMCRDSWRWQQMNPQGFE